ncbi:MAG: 50S ribosomal protein L11 methyltransferase [Desulfobacteraceae bacterium]|jgi:ribosomal protein L11 methyltransferase
MSSPKQPQWLEISIEIDPVAHDALSAYLFDLGCEGIVVEDAPRQVFKAYFSLRKDWQDIQNKINAFLRKLADIFPEAHSPELIFSKIEKQDWNHQWRRFFRPDRITKRLTIFPAWESVPKDIEDHVIRIQPGLAFGTGQHPTSRMCLEAMERVSLPESWTMLDVGTGSGILAIYGAKLGASRITALDVDPEAIRSAQGNIRLNHVSGPIELSSMPLEELKGRFSLLTANLTLGLILQFFPHFSRLVDPGGWLILSGLLIGQAREVEVNFLEYGFSESEALYQAEWTCIIAKKERGT